MLVLRCLGQAEATIEPSQPEADYFLGPGKPLALLVWLAAMPGRSCRRELAIDLLWSDVEPEQARHALRQTIWHLRRKLHDSIIVATRESLAIGLEVRSDHVGFLAAVNAGRFEEAVALYSGDFLPDLALPGGVDFEHWADIERRQIRLAYLHAARAVTRSWVEASRHREAIALARTIRDTDKSEASWRLVLETLIAARDELGATLEADALEQTLGDPSSLEPSTRALLRTARHSTSESGERARDTGLIAELVGREGEFSMLMSAWESARLGDPAIVRIIAAAGLGKTRLLNDLAARLRAMRARVVMLPARPADRDVPFAHAADVAAALSSLKGAAAISPANAGALVGLNPSLSSIYSAAADAHHGDDAFLHRAIAMRELVAAVADEAPVAVLLDDHHWADPESRRLMAAVIGKLEHPSVLIVVASRPGYSEIPINDTQRIDLLPLSGANTTALVSSLGELPRDPWAAMFCSMLHDVSGGSPLLVLETLHSLMERKLLALHDGKWATPDAGELLAARNAPNAIDSRVRASSDSERMVLAVMAVYGAPMGTRLIADVMATQDSEVLVALAELETRGLVAGDGQRWWPAHDLLSESFADRLTAEERARIERAIADRLVTEMNDEGSLVRAARHYVAAGMTEFVGDAFVSWLEIRRRHGDMRSVRRLMSAFAPELSGVRGMWSRVPLHLRFPRWKPVTVTAMAVIVGGVGALKALAPAETAPDSVLAVWYDSAGTTYQWDIPVRRGALTNDDMIEVKSGARRRSAFVPARPRFEISPDGKHWAGDVVFSDSGGMDVVITDPTLHSMTRVSSRDDDLAPTWSPDGRFLVFITGRFNEHHWNDLAIYDVERKSVRQLTSGPDIDGPAFWSPLGNRIAFSRHLADKPGWELCQMDLTGAPPSCNALPQAAGAAPLGWYDDHRLVLYVNYPDTASGMRQVIEMMDFDDGGTTRELYRSPVASFVALSPDGKWLACACKFAAGGVPRWFVFPLDNPELRAEVVRDRIESEPIIVGWMGRRRENTYLERIEIDRASAVQPLNVPLRLTATGIRADGRRVDDLAVQWSIVSGDAARLDGDVLTPKHAGTVRVRATAGGWRTVDADLTIGGAALAPLHTSKWDEPLDPTWILFGSPHSTVSVDSMFGHALFLNGDGSFASGTLSRRVFAASDGLVIDVAVSVKIRARQWQSATIGFLEEPDTATAEPAPSDSTGPGIGRRMCSVGMPAAEGDGMQRTLALASNTSSITAPASAATRTGAVQHLALHLFPDGSCGLTIDGKIVARLLSSGRPFKRARVLLSGQGVDTRIAIGPLTVFAGSDPRVDWRKKDK